MAGCIPGWNSEVQEQFFPAAPLGPRGRGPLLRAFLLLAALQIARLLCCMIASLMVCSAIHIILPCCCKQWLQCERSLHWWVVIWLGLLLHAQLELSLHHLLPHWLFADAHVSWRRVLRTPPHLPFLGRGVPQVEIGRAAGRQAAAGRWQRRGDGGTAGWRAAVQRQQTAGRRLDANGCF